MQAMEDIADIVFLRQEKLSEDLAKFLSDIGYSDEEAEYVKQRDRVNVTRAKTLDRNALWTPTAVTYIQRRERLMFRLLEAKGIVYEMPEIGDPS